MDLTIYLSATLVIHQKTVVGIRGMLNFSIEASVSFLTDLKEKFLQTLNGRRRISIVRKSAMTTESTYPVTPIPNTTRNRMFSTIVNTVPRIP